MLTSDEMSGAKMLINGKYVSQEEAADALRANADFYRNAYKTPAPIARIVISGESEADKEYAESRKKYRKLIEVNDFSISQISHKTYEDLKSKQDDQMGRKKHKSSCEKTKDKKKSRILCGGRCITGPSRGDSIPFSVLTLVGTSTIISMILTFEELFSVDGSLGFLLMLTFASLCGLSTVIS